MALPPALAQALAAGPIDVATYMQHCLYDSQTGYYMTRVPMGADIATTDFVTAPELCQAFGEVVGAWVAQGWQFWGRPELWQLVEVGAGRGTLLADILRTLQQVAPAALQGLQVFVVEISPTLQQAQQHTLRAWQTLPHPPVWAPTVAAIPVSTHPTVVLSNELFDALPVRQFQRQGADWFERLIALSATNELIWQLAPQACTEAAVLTYAAAYPQHSVIEYCPGLVGLVQALQQLTTGPQRHWHCDYGAQGTAETLQAVQRHQMVSPLAHPGEADLTCQVNFHALQQAYIAPWQSQCTDLSIFLHQHGFASRVTALMAAQPNQAEALATQAAKLLDPRQMGALHQVFTARR